jgi:predicted phosphoribosyltransferase
MAFYKNRRDAGRRLGEILKRYRGMPGLLALGLPRGGVPVAAEVARTLGASLDLFLVRKLGVPGAEELAMGAIAQGGARVRNEEVTVLAVPGDPGDTLDRLAAEADRVVCPFRPEPFFAIGAF